MAYVMEYHLQDIQKSTVKKLKHQKKYWPVIWLIIGVLALNSGRAIIQMYTEGEQHVVQQAAEQMVEDIKNGVDFQNAVSTFCSEIVQ
jgi:hypothetical protein